MELKTHLNSQNSCLKNVSKNMNFTFFNLLALLIIQEIKVKNSFFIWIRGEKSPSKIYAISTIQAWVFVIFPTI
jgi:hypothetical protein